MKLTTTTTHDITFRVESFWDEEGGMGRDAFGKPVDTLQEAVRLLEIVNAQAGKDGPDWIITATVKSVTK